MADGSTNPECLIQIADLIDLLTGWMIMHSDICRPEDLSSLFHTLATINYPTVHAEELKNLVNSVQERTFARVNEWLNFVWSLAVLDLVSAKHIDSVLRYGADSARFTFLLSRTDIDVCVRTFVTLILPVPTSLSNWCASMAVTCRQPPK